MSRFTELDNYLQTEFSADNWSDSSVEFARTAIQEFEPSDWLMLEAAWPERSSAWQQRCAQILPWGNLEFAVPILLRMVQAPDDELVIDAVDSLRDINENIMPLEIPDHVRRRLQAVANHHPGVSSLGIKALLARLETPKQS